MYRLEVLHFYYISRYYRVLKPFSLLKGYQQNFIAFILFKDKL